jgi:hypothetical protein
MGTRHRQAVITKEGQLKVQQYGQWDGYPSGQGVEILNFLKSANLEKYQEELGKLKILTDAEVEKIDNEKDWDKKYPFLSRDCGSKIHSMITEGKVPFVYHIQEKEAQQWCEGFYTINFQKGVFISEFNGETVTLKLDKLPSQKAYLKKFKDGY